ncbi:YgcG family protein [Mucilaginibacter galii]|uniref:TPM domain-containing protein n=1 Tax=Mucilaginibacter galii TaxID=2005073 RepID=A0A917J4W5_9SPHI|nr:TPM domain-containing protein [Mucilaginibacter galii]GGI49088.1 hypothetical protein GCM10011425_03000 [Mucilaginibacter galii]
MKQFFLLLSLLVATVSFGKIPERQKNTYVNDFAHVLSTNEVEALNAKIHRIERLSGVQMAVVLVDKVPAEYDIDEFALLIGRKWHVGKHKDGLVYVAAISQHKQRIELGRALSDKLSDGKSAEILDLMKPYFRKQDYNGGLDAMIDAVGTEVIPANTQAATPARQQQRVVQVKEKPSTAADTFATIITAAIFIGIPVLIIWLIVRYRRNRRNMVFQQNTGYNNPGYGGGNYPGGGYGNGGPVINNYGGGGYGGSGIGSNLGSFAAGAATGYAVRSIQDNMNDDDDDRHRHHNNNDDYDRNNVVSDSDNDSDNTDYSVNDEDRDSSNWGDYGSSSDSSDSDSSDNDSSSDSGFDGDRGATSDW